MGACWINQQDENRFLTARNGDFLHFPFQCDLCWFRNIKFRSPRETSNSDKNLLMYIRRANLDGMWSREPGTVRNIRTSLVKLIKYCHELSFEPTLPKLGPWPIGDKVGFQVALAQLKYSQESGLNRSTHMQFDTIRKLRTAYSHIHEVSAEASAGHTNSFRTLMGKVFSNSNCPTQSRLFQKVMEGMLGRMGKQSKANMALDYKILHLILETFEDELNLDKSTEERKRRVTLCGSFLLLGFVLSLRGPEGFMIEAHGLISHLHFGLGEECREDDEIPFVVIPLLGRFKNEEGERWHLMMSVSETKSGFKVREWVERLASVLVKEGHTSGPAFCHPDGKCLRAFEIDEEFHKQLEKIQISHPMLIEPKLDVTEWFSIFRSLRKGSTARADELDISNTVTNLHNRWRTTEFLKGGRTSRSMREYYTSLRLSRKVRLKYTRDL